LNTVEINTSTNEMHEYFVTRGESDDREVHVSLEMLCS
jgi:hypothetical protein